jgi:CBS domain-containing protein
MPIKSLERLHSPVGWVSGEAFAPGSGETVSPKLGEVEAMLVRDVMRNPISVHAEETLEVATLRMKEENVGALPVVEDDQVVGMITDRDVLLRGFPEGRDIHTKTRESMSVKPILCHEDDTLEHALELMSHNHVRRLPVMDHKENLVGILSVNDLTAPSSKPPALEVVFYRQLPDSTGHVHNVQLTRVAVARGHSRSEAVQAAIQEFEKERNVTRWSEIAHGYEILPAGEVQDR